MPATHPTSQRLRRRRERSARRRLRSLRDTADDEYRLTERRADARLDRSRRRHDQPIVEPAQLGMRRPLVEQTGDDQPGEPAGHVDVTSRVDLEPCTAEATAQFCLRVAADMADR